MGLFNFRRPQPPPSLWRPTPASFPAIAMKIGEGSHKVRQSWWGVTVESLKSALEFDVPPSAKVLSGRILTAVTAFQVTATGEYLKAHPHIDRDESHGFISALFFAVLGPDTNAWAPFLDRYQSTLTVRDQYRLAKDLANGLTRGPHEQFDGLIALLTAQASALNLLSVGVAAEAFQNPAAFHDIKRRLDLLAANPFAIYEELKRLPADVLE